jgi:hypothetical protein
MSAVFATKEAILTVLAARAALDGVTLAWAGPTKDSDFAAEMVFLADTEESSQWQALGGGQRFEEWTQSLVVFVEQWGDDPKAAEQRARDLWGEVEDALRDDLFAAPSILRTAGLLDFGEGVITRRVSTGPSTPEKWGARVDATVQLRARNQ